MIELTPLEAVEKLWIRANQQVLKEFSTDEIAKEIFFIENLTWKEAAEATLDSNMPTQELLLHMGELTKDEILVARAAIAWANRVRGVE